MNWPRGRYRVITADPPWRYQNWTDAKNGAARAHYTTMPVKDIGALPVGDLAHARGCALLLWATWPKLPEALRVMDAWGFRFVTCAFVWVKTYRDGGPYCGLGFYTRSATEFCLLGLRGRMSPQVRDVRQVITAPVRGHSQKPNELYGRVERLWPGPYLELFARQQRPGWDAWGDQLEETAEEVA